MENTARKTTRKNHPKGNTVIFTMFLSMFIVLIGRLIYADMIGETGMGYFAAVYEWVTFVLLIIGSFLPQAEARAVRNRLAKGQIKNAERVLKATLLFSGAIGGICCFLQVVFAEVLAGKVLLAPLAVLAVLGSAPILVLSVLLNAYRGFFEGIGSVVPTNISRILEQIFALVFGLIFGKIFFDYGEKRGRLVQNENFAAAYSIVGIAIGVILAQVLILLFMLFIKGTYATTLKRQMNRDNSKIKESYADIIRGILSGGFSHMLTILMMQGTVFVNMYLYLHYTKENTAQKFTLHYGSFYAKYAIMTGLLVCLIGMTMAKPLSAIMHYHKREEYRAVKEYFAGGLHTLVLYGIPAAVLLAVLAEPAVDMFFGTAKGTVFLLQVSSTLVVLIPCAIFFVMVLQLVGKQMIALRNCAAAFVAQTVMTIVFLHVLHVGIASVAYGYMVLFGVMAILNGLSIFRYLKYSPEYIRMFVMPVVSSAICGVLTLVLSKALLEKTGGLVTTICCAVLGSVGYVVLIFALKSVNEKELNRIAGGRLLLKVGQILRLF